MNRREHPETISIRLVLLSVLTRFENICLHNPSGFSLKYMMGKAMELEAAVNLVYLG